MTAKGHLLLASSFLLTTNLLVEIPMFEKIYPVVLLGAVLPDIDEERSFIGRKTGALSVIIHALFGHRTVTHYFLLPLILSIIGLVYHKPYVIALAVGILLHDIGDLLTKGGIVGFFYPFLPNTTIALLPRRYRFYTGSFHETVLIVFMAILHLFLLVPQIKEFV